MLFLRETKTGARQAVRVADSNVATILVAWRDARAQVAGADAALFPPASGTTLRRLPRFLGPTGVRLGSISYGIRCAMAALAAR